MSIIDQNTTDKNILMNEELYQNSEQKQTNKEIAEQGFTVRNGYDPNKPNPDHEKITNDEEDLDDLNDDFHTDRDLDDDDELDKIDIDGNEKILNDEFDNPTDDFDETEEDLEDIDQDEDEEEYKEDDIQEEDEEENYPDNDPRKF
ncbi:hypothetical protein [Flavobacterium pectinovorum]|uniref:hypothetical protein n=1 Tax=Flavobacterium pectinovorum TaxID=29533 RepID=UPI001FABA15B|nr:hypothetical protein [Flavobacterium pectinovorum]MCI9844840.1 hypothetical protein [Flavobacterium pectinovorum]